MSSSATATDAPASTYTRWTERLFNARNALLADARFQRWAARFPLTRFIAARRAKRLFDLCAGFVYAQTLLACSRLQLLEALRDGPMTPVHLATTLGVPLDRLELLLTAARALDLIEVRRDKRVGLGSQGAAFLGNSAAAAMVEHHALFYRDLADPAALVRGEASTALASFWSYDAQGHDRQAEPISQPDGVTAMVPSSSRRATQVDYSAIMAATQPLIADDILDAYPFEKHRHLLDIGGGTGTFVRAVAARRADIALTVFDLPQVAEQARAALDVHRLANPVAVIGGDFRTDPLPSGADLVSLVRIAHDHDDATVAALLAKIADALPPGGVLLLAEPLAERRGSETVGAYFALYLMAMGQGRPRGAEELQTMLYRAGFARVQQVKTARPLFTSLFVAQKSAGTGNRL